MKRILLLLLILFACTVTKAQQKVLDSLLNELNKHPQEDTGRLNLLNKISAEYYAINPSNGLKISDAAITLAQKLKADERLAIAYKNMALNYKSKGERALSLQYFNKAMNICKKSGLKKLEADLYRNIGVVYFDMSEYATAMKMQEQSLKLAMQINDSAAMARAYISTGLIYHYISDYPEALKYQQKALEIFSSINYRPGIADAFNNTGMIYLNLGDFPTALTYYKKAFEINRQMGDKQAMANVLGNMANVYDNVEDSLNAIQYYQKALAVSEEIDYTSGIANNTGNIGVFHYYQGNFILAASYLKKALALYEKLNDKNNQSLMLNILGDTYFEAPDAILLQAGIKPANRYSTAIGYYGKALSLARNIKALRRQVFVLESLSNVYEKQNDYKKALGFYRQAVTINDSIVNDSKNKQITRLEMQYEFSRTQDSVKAVSDKELALVNAEMQKEHVIKNSMIAGGGFLMLSGFGCFVFYKRNRDIKTKKNEAEFKAKVTDVEMKALRAQMNPHFIFNSLNSIADYIDKNQTKIASDFTTKFARLMRMVLENSEHTQVPLADDLKALELYMQLESFRLQNKFTYTINVDENIDKENTLVPPLILQPFVENSIWHGIAKKEGHGSIKIFIKREGNNINCIVEDDGIGFKDDLINKERTSLGMRITKARIDIINKLKNTNASMHIANKEKGVRAEVALPLVLSF